MVDTLQRAINDTRTHMRDATLVYCMTERYDNPTLWEVYANNYSGFCIEYYFGDFFKKDFDDYIIIGELSLDGKIKKVQWSIHRNQLR